MGRTYRLAIAMCTPHKDSVAVRPWNHAALMSLLTQNLPMKKRQKLVHKDFVHVNCGGILVVDQGSTASSPSSSSR
jgi:hypothetical protein